MPHDSDFIPHPTVRRRSLRWITVGLLLVSGLIAQPAEATTYRSTIAWINTASTVTANHIERSLDGVNFTLLATVAPTPASYQDNGLAAGAAYYYRVRSHTPAGNSDYSATTIGTTPPALSINSPTDYQLVTNGIIHGTARGANGLQRVTINGRAAVLNGTNWVATASLIPGTNTLTVIATDNSADHNTTTQIVHAIVPPAPVANFTGSPTTGPAPLLVNFTDTSPGLITSRLWTFGDGTTSTTANPSHTYAAAGSYTVTLTVTGPAGSAQLKRSRYVTVAKKSHSQKTATNGATDTGTLRILDGPVVTNALTQIGDVAVVIAGQPVAFTVTATSTVSSAVEYRWDFGDQQTSYQSVPVHTYPATNCQSYTARVKVNNSVNWSTGIVHVATACQLELTALQMKPNFGKPNADRFTLSASLDLGAAFHPNGQRLAVDLGRAQVAFQLNRAGRGKSASGKCRLAYNTRTGLWDLTVRSKGGNWHELWVAYDLVQGPLSVPAISVTVPVIVIVGHAGFAAEPQMQYSAPTEQLGYAD